MLKITLKDGLVTAVEQDGTALTEGTDYEVVEADEADSEASDESGEKTADEAGTDESQAQA